MPASSSVTIRPADRSEAATIARACRLHVEYGLPPYWTAGRIARAIEDPNCRLLVADLRGDIAGFALARRDCFSLHLQLIAVLPPHRRRQLGSRLLESLENDGIAAGLRCMRLEVRSGNHAARRFYRRHGYCMLAVRPDFYGSREPAAVMARTLETPRGAQASA